MQLECASQNLSVRSQEKKESTAETLINKAKERFQRSRGWQFYIYVDRNHAQCKICRGIISYKSAVSNLSKHILIRHRQHLQDTAQGSSISKNKKMHAKPMDENQKLITRRVSFIWKFFTILENGFPQCNICQMMLSRKSSTGNLHRHMRRSHPSVAPKLGTGLQMVRYSSQDNQNQQSNKLDQEVECILPIVHTFNKEIEPTSDEVNESQAACSGSDSSECLLTETEEDGNQKPTQVMSLQSVQAIQNIIKSRSKSSRRKLTTAKAIQSKNKKITAIKASNPKKQNQQLNPLNEEAGRNSPIIHTFIREINSDSNQIDEFQAACSSPDNRECLLNVTEDDNQKDSEPLSNRISQKNSESQTTCRSSDSTKCLFSERLVKAVEEGNELLRSVHGALEKQGEALNRLVAYFEAMDNRQKKQHVIKFYSCSF